jgi:hypothetical protein
MTRPNIWLFGHVYTCSGPKPCPMRCMYPPQTKFLQTCFQLVIWIGRVYDMTSSCLWSQIDLFQTCGNWLSLRHMSAGSDQVSIFGLRWLLVKLMDNHELMNLWTCHRTHELVTGLVNPWTPWTTWMTFHRPIPPILYCVRISKPHGNSHAYPCISCTSPKRDGSDKNHST